MLLHTNFLQDQVLEATTCLLMGRLFQQCQGCAIPEPRNQNNLSQYLYHYMSYLRYLCIASLSWKRLTGDFSMMQIPNRVFREELDVPSQLRLLIKCALIFSLKTM